MSFDIEVIMIVFKLHHQVIGAYLFRNDCWILKRNEKSRIEERLPFGISSSRRDDADARLLFHPRELLAICSNLQSCLVEYFKLTPELGC